MKNNAKRQEINGKQWKKWKTMQNNQKQMEKNENKWKQYIKKEIFFFDFFKKRKEYKKRNVVFCIYLIFRKCLRAPTCMLRARYVHATCTPPCTLRYVHATCTLRARYVHATCMLRARWPTQPYVRATCMLRVRYVYAFVAFNSCCLVVFKINTFNSCLFSCI